MRYLLVVAASLSALALGACDRPAAVAPSTPVIVQVPGPAGPQGAPGNAGEKGDQGKPGDGTIMVVPVPETKP